ncbi:hypothetical protein scyTo_0005937 [Scyliorhinus torazame]|uniref:Uncharacterized protein n=1 Tax=Scyliorhinus torazame TaxID=75743 RepID=A0A401PE82_SCYTO|nr:hypothetical protein [Scyliorhinus torazame]
MVSKTGSLQWGPGGNMIQTIVIEHRKLIKKMVEKGYDSEAPEAEQKAWWLGQTKNKAEMAAVILAALMKNCLNTEAEQKQAASLRKVQEEGLNKPLGRMVAEPLYPSFPEEEGEQGKTDEVSFTDEAAQYNDYPPPV